MNELLFDAIDAACQILCHLSAVNSLYTRLLQTTSKSEGGEKQQNKTKTNEYLMFLKANVMTSTPLCLCAKIPQTLRV